MSLDTTAIRREFPILSQRIDGNPLTYLDSAATAQKPKAVLDAMTAFYETANANAHRGMHPLAEAATVAYEGARETVRGFLNAAHADEIIFTKSCTESINLVAIAGSRGGLFGKGDRIVLSLLEHHANIVPWQQLAARKGAETAWIDIRDEGDLQMSDLEKHLAGGNVKLVAVTAMSNVLGTKTPIAEIVKLAHAHGALVLVDAAQAVAHERIDVRAWDCDFLAFSAHKLYGPTGIGVLYGKREILKTMPPFLGGGMMIGEVTTGGFTPADVPARFEGGTPAVAEAVGLKTAIDWLSRFDWKEIAAHEQALIARTAEQLKAIPGLQILGSPAGTSLLSFVVDGIHPHDLTEILGTQGICLRAGHHCAQPLHRRLNIAASTRLSVGIYNTAEEIDRVAPAIAAAISRLRG